MRLKAASNPVRVECRHRDSCPWQWESYSYGGGGGYTTLRLPTLDSCSCGKGRGRLGGWADRQRHLPSVCVVPRHVFKWHRLHFNSDIIHKCGTAAYNSERRKLHCYRKEQGEGKTTVDTELPTRVGERERVKKKNKTFGYNPPLARAQLPSARFTSWNNWNNPRQGPRVKSRTHTRMNKERQTKLMLVVGFLQTPDAASKSA